MTRLNTCPDCGRYTWAHPFSDCARTFAATTHGVHEVHEVQEWENEGGAVQ